MTINHIHTPLACVGATVPRHLKVAVHVCSLIIHELQEKKIMRTLYQDETRYNGAKTSNRGAKDCSSAAILKLSSDVKWLGSSDHKAHR